MVLNTTIWKIYIFNIIDVINVKLGTHTAHDVNYSNAVDNVSVLLFRAHGI